METRSENHLSEKKSENINEFPSRVTRNQSLYKKMNTDDMEDYKVNSNVSVLNVKGDEINIDRLRQILDKKYRETPVKRSLDIEIDKEEDTSTLEGPTKEYDLSSVIEKAKENKVLNYEEERLKKIRDTQFDILKEIIVEEVEEEPSNSDSKTSAEEELMTLIKTITNKENNKLDPLDMFEDLKGNENTNVIPPVSEIDKELENSFYTGKLAVKDDDYEEFEELSKEINSNRILIKILLFIVFVIVIFAIVFLLDKVFTWGIF